MKWIYKVIVILSAFFVCCSNFRTPIPQITLNDSTCIKIIAENITDTFYISTTYCSKFPQRSCFRKSLELEKSGIYYIFYRMQKPDLITFELSDTFKTLTIPRDTLCIKVNMHIDANGNKSLQCNINNKFYEYYQRKNERFGFYDLAEFVNSQFEYLHTSKIELAKYYEVIHAINKLAKENLNFLTSFKKGLPKWFYKFEEANIFYGAALQKDLLNSRLSTNCAIDNPIASIEINNPDAILSSNYYCFIQNYLFNAIPINEIALNGTKLTVKELQAHSKVLDSALDEQIKDYYISCKLSDLYYSASSMEDINMADLFISSNYPLMSEDKKRFIDFEKYTITSKLKKSHLRSGEKAPDFYLKDINEKSYNLSILKGKYLYINFYATWCSPCIQDIPLINDLAQKMAGEPFVIVNICLDDNKEKWIKLVQKQNLHGINLICKGNWVKILKEGYNISSVPHFALIDKNGMIIYNKCEGPATIHKTLKSIIQSN